MIIPIDWNTIEDSIDLEVWNRLTTNFWLPEKVPLSNDLRSWGELTAEEQLATRKVFAGLTLLDTLQGTVGAVSIIPDSRTPHEEAVITNISFMESVHARSYSSIFSTLCSTEEINEIFRWAKDDPTLQSKAEIIKECYDIRERTTEAAAYRKAASVMLESFMFYSGFYLPFKLASQGRLTNTADIIRLILRDEGVHGYYLGYKFQQHRRELTEEQRDRLDYWIDTKIRQLYFLEAKFSEDLYDEIGWTENVKTYLRYNANKAMQNLGYDSIFSDSETRVEAAIMSSMTVDANETHDFFSGSGSSYVMAEVEETTDDDWD
ncbi:ribonucleotide reductase [Corynebacterium phage Kimchi1738]|uniref:ribonucleoside-diphosphate reductase n=1 Tax=Corynebacterium phage Kimchi1738 TaxID=2483719 RepID=A0A3G3LWI4_9CAUD|nr:ribonucleotide reductase class Ia beta subunit [Corynebacterium phage Kimchi1738]AYQ98461.1 ribonucleotide reductase [Corynebacterium phage Kimchi1738]